MKLVQKHWVAAVLSLSFGSVLASDIGELEPNNTFPPTSIFTLFESGDKLTGSITAGDVDQHYITLNGAGLPGIYRYTFDVACGGEDSVLNIYDDSSSGFLLTRNEDFPGRGQESVAVFDHFDTSGASTTFGVSIRHFTQEGTIPSYAITFSRSATPVTVLGTLAGGVHTFTGNIAGGAGNWYRFTVGLDSVLTADTIGTNAEIDTELALFNSQGTTMRANDDVALLSNMGSNLTSPLPAGTYYLAVGAFDSTFNWNVGTNLPVGWNMNGFGHSGTVPAGTTPYTVNIRLTPTVAFPLSYVVTDGYEIGGGITDLVASDDAYLAVLSGDDLGTQIEFTSVSPIATPSQIKITAETATTRFGLVAVLAARNYTSSTWVEVDGRIAPTSDTVVVGTINANVSQFIGPSNEIKARLSWNPINDEDPAQDGWVSFVDLLRWDFTQ